MILITADSISVISVMKGSSVVRQCQCLCFHLPFEILDGKLLILGLDFYHDVMGEL